MADAQISNLTAGVNTGGPTSVSDTGTALTEGPAADFSVVSNGTTYTLSTYISGGNTALKGVYTFNALNGVVSAATYPGVNPVTVAGGSFN